MTKTLPTRTDDPIQEELSLPKPRDSERESNLNGGRGCNMLGRASGTRKVEHHSPCQTPAVKGKHRFRMHGSAHGSGAPGDKRHDHYRHGFWTKDATAARKAAIALVKCGRSDEEVDT